MELAFETKELRSICESETCALLELGVVSAEALKHRLADLLAAQSVHDLMQLPMGLLYDGSEGINLFFDLTCGKKLVFTNNHIKPPLLEEGRIDWTKVSRIRILAINNHE